MGTPPANSGAPPCFHSSGPQTHPDCIGCWAGQAIRCEAENRRLNALIREFGNEAMNEKLDEFNAYWRGGTIASDDNGS